MRPKFYRLRWPRWHDAPNRGAHATSGAPPARARRMRRHLTPAGRLRILQMAIPAGLLLFDQSVTGVTDSPPSACTTTPNVGLGGRNERTSGLPNYSGR